MPSREATLRSIMPQRASSEIRRSQRLSRFTPAATINSGKRFPIKIWCYSVHMETNALYRAKRVRIVWPLLIATVVRVSPTMPSAPMERQCQSALPIRARWRSLVRSRRAFGTIAVAAMQSLSTQPELVSAFRNQHNRYQLRYRYHSLSEKNRIK